MAALGFDRWREAFAVIAVAVFLNGCSSAADETAANDPAPTFHSTFDLSAAERVTTSGDEAYAAGNLSQARGIYVTALNQWPLYGPAWMGLGNIAKDTDDQGLKQFVLFYASRIEWIETTDLGVAAGGFENVALGRTTISPLNDDIQSFAATMVAFLNERESERQFAERKPMSKETLYRVLPAAVISGGGLIGWLASKFAN